MALRPVAVHHLDLADLRARHHDLAGDGRPGARGAHLQGLVDGGAEQQRKRAKQDRVGEPRQIGHEFPQATLG